MAKKFLIEKWKLIEKRMRELPRAETTEPLLVMDIIEVDLKELFKPKEDEVPYTGEYAMGWNDCLKEILGDKHD